MLQILDRAYIDKSPNFVIQVNDTGNIQWHVLRKHLSYFPLMTVCESLADAIAWCESHPSVSEAKEAEKKLKAFNRIQRPLDVNFHHRARIILSEASGRVDNAQKADKAAKKAVEKWIRERARASEITERNRSANQ